MEAKVYKTSNKQYPEKIRVSLGSAAILGLARCVLDAQPTTAYLLTYNRSRCTANCAFCPQARESTGRADKLSRVTWPLYETKGVIPSLRTAFKQEKIRRVCLQSLNYPNVVEDILSLVQEIKKHTDIPVSVSCQPLTKEDIFNLAEAGVNRLGIPLDASTKTLFKKVKGVLDNGPYIWEEHLKSLKMATKVLGTHSVTTHLIVGLGETEEEVLHIMQWCVDNGIYPALFAFTPIPGTKMQNHPRPPVSTYRRVQVAQYLITNLITTYEEMKFEKGRLQHLNISEKQLGNIIQTGEPFTTKGCPDCNRPDYNEKPGGPIYNYPQEPNEKDLENIKREIQPALILS